MADDDWTRFARGMAEIADAPLVLGRPKDRDITALAEHISELASTGTLLFVVDPLHIAIARRDLPYENREREVSEIVRRLKVLALDLEIAIVVTSHLTNNPGPRQAVPRPPTLADLRDSGVIAHVADTVILLDRPDMYDHDSDRGGEVDLTVAKSRYGPAFTTTVAHQLHLARLVDMVRT